MAVNLEESVKQWKGLDLKALSAIQSMHNASLCLINSVMSEKLSEATRVLPTLTSMSTTFETSMALPMQTTIVQYGTLVNGTTIPVDMVAITMTWKTAFSLLALVLISVWLQDCGRVCGISKDFVFFVRSSPIFCLVDTVLILLQYLYHVTRKGSRAAIRYVAASRKQHVATQSRDENIVVVSVIAILHICVLFRTSSISGTQFVAACYVSSYWTNYILNKYGKPHLDLNEVKTALQEDQTEDADPGLTAILAMLGQIALWTSSLEGALPQNAEDITVVFGDQLGTVLLYTSAILTFMSWALHHMVAMMSLVIVDAIITFAPAAIMLYLCFLHPRFGWPSIIEITRSIFGITTDAAAMGLAAVLAIIWLLLHVLFYPFALSGMYSDKYIDNAPPNELNLYLERWGRHFVVLVLISVAAALSYIIARILLFGKLGEKLGLRNRSIASNMGWACMFLFATNIVSAWFYYTKVYDSIYTYTPS